MWSFIFFVLIGGGAENEGPSRTLQAREIIGEIFKFIVPEIPFPGL
jgi:tartrate dehydratase alpha subunit/fumarate hydratase class I-like protein